MGFFVQVTHHFPTKNLRLASSQPWCNTPTTLRPKWPRFVARHGSWFHGGWRVGSAGCVFFFCDDFMVDLLCQYMMISILKQYYNYDVLYRLMLTCGDFCWCMMMCVDLCISVLICVDVRCFVLTYVDLWGFMMIYVDLSFISVDLFWCMMICV